MLTFMAFNTFNRRQVLCGGLAVASSAMLAPLLASGSASAGTGAGPVGARAFEYKGQLHYVNRSVADDLEHLWYAKGATSWGRETKHGRTAVSGVNGLFWPDKNQAHMFARDNSDQVSHWWQNPDGAWGDEQLRFSTTKEPASAIFQGYLYVMVSDSWDTWFYAQHPTSNIWEDGRVGDSFTHDPTALVSGGQLHVFGRTSTVVLGEPNPRVRLLHYWRGGASGFSPGEVLPLDIDSRPAVVVAHNQVHVFGRRNTGQNNEGGTLWHWWQPVGGGEWRSEDLFGNFIGNPEASVWKDQIHVYARTVADQLYHWWDGPGGWNRFPLLATKPTGNPDPLYGDPAAITWADQNHVLGLTRSANVHHWYYQTGWSDEQLTAGVHS
jgi:hypothetical protein